MHFFNGDECTVCIFVVNGANEKFAIGVGCGRFSMLFHLVDKREVIATRRVMFFPVTL